MLKELKEFAIKGNVVDMAVGIIIGAAFTTVVRSLVDDVLMPPIGLATGGLDFASHMIVLRQGATAGPYATPEAARAAGAVVMAWGTLVNAAISFTLVAIALFFIVRWVNHLRRPQTPAAPTTRSCPFCKSSIDKGASRCPFCTSQIEGAATA